MIEQPGIGDGEAAWRRYAGDVRQQLGELRSRLTTAAIAQLTARATTAETRAAALERKWSRSEWTLDNLERDLEAGDIDRARSRLAGRRRRIERKTHGKH